MEGKKRGKTKASKGKEHKVKERKEEKKRKRNECGDKHVIKMRSKEEEDS